MLSSVIVFFTGILGLVLFIIILNQYKSNKIFNIYFALLVLLVSIRYTIIGIKNLTKDVFINETYKKTDVLFIVTVPIIYLYFKNLIKSQRKFVTADLFHFITPILFIIEIKFRIIELAFGVKKDFGLLNIFILILVFYNFLTFLLLKNNVWNKKGSLEIMVNQNSLIKRWSVYVYVCMNLMMLRLFISLYLEMHSNSVISGQNFVWASALVWIIIFIKLLTSRNILYGYAFLNNEKGKIGNKVKTSHWKFNENKKITNIQDIQLNLKINGIVKQYLNNVDLAIENNNYFRDSTFSLNDLALKLNIPKSHLTFIYKYHSKISFSDFKKISRINDAVNLIDNDYLKTNTFDSLSKFVGFSSYNPFFTSFKDVIGKAPQEYVDALIKKDK